MGQLDSGPVGPMASMTPGSIGPGTTPGRVYPGKKMPGHMGNVRSMEKNLMVVKVDKDIKVIAIKGSVPGKKGNLLTISKSKRPNFNVDSSGRRAAAASE